MVSVRNMRGCATSKDQMSESLRVVNICFCGFRAFERNMNHKTMPAKAMTKGSRFLLGGVTISVDLGERNTQSAESCRTLQQFCQKTMRRAPITHSWETMGKKMKEGSPAKSPNSQVIRP